MTQGPPPETDRHPDSPFGEDRSVPTVVYTDGACSGNPGPGGWAWAVPDGPLDSGAEPETTNQRMELRAVLEALESIHGPVEVFSDSTYVVNCFNDRWYEGWLQRDWRNAQKKPVANRDLWEPLVEIFRQRRHELSFTWVKGHSGDAMNDLVDRLAVEARDRLMGESVGPGGGGHRPPPWPVERAVAVTGVADPGPELMDDLDQVLGGLDPGFDIVVSGLRRGPELDGAEMALAHRLPLAVVLPFPEPARGWPGRLQRRFESCVERAEWLVELDGDPAKPGTAVRHRDEWMAEAVVGYIVVGDSELAARLDEVGLGVVVVDDSGDG